MFIFLMRSNEHGPIILKSSEYKTMLLHVHTNHPLSHAMPWHRIRLEVYPMNLISYIDIILIETNQIAHLIVIVELSLTRQIILRVRSWSRTILIWIVSDRCIFTYIIVGNIVGVFRYWRFEQDLLKNDYGTDREDRR
jgi:hypothetical protein